MSFVQSINNIAVVRRVYGKQRAMHCINECILTTSVDCCSLMDRTQSPPPTRQLPAGHWPNPIRLKLNQVWSGRVRSSRMAFLSSVLLPTPNSFQRCAQCAVSASSGETRHQCWWKMRNRNVQQQSYLYRATGSTHNQLLLLLLLRFYRLKYVDFASNTIILVLVVTN